MASKRGSVVLCLVRSGETAWEAEGRVHGMTDLPMSEAGRSAVAASLDRALIGSMSAVHHAPDEASTETARMLSSRTRARLRSVKELIDPDMGLLEGLAAADFEERYPSRQRQFEADVLTLEPPEGEPIVKARARILGAVHKVMRRSRSGEVGIVLGDYGVGFVRTWLANLPASQLRDLQTARPHVERYLIPLALLDDLESAIQTQSGR
jgi:probable phosphoglycerate mutase